MNRKITREEAIKILYSMDIGNEYDIKFVQDYLDHFSNEDSDDLTFNIEAIDINYLNKTTLDIINNLEIIDKKIEDNSKTWKINRIAKIDLSILRVALAEILYNELIPNATSINEAVKISKKYSADESYKFINGILGSVCRSL